MFSNWGTFPDWSPYQERVVQEAITFKQGNRFYANTYTGPVAVHRARAGQAGQLGDLAGRPYGQDHDSVVKVGR